jgi:hypothetical protein
MLSIDLFTVIHNPRPLELQALFTLSSLTLAYLALALSMFSLVSHLPASS